MRFVHLLTASFFLLIGLSGLLSDGQNISPVVITNEELVTLSEYSAEVSWITNIASDSRIQWGTTDGLGNETVRSEETRYHIIGINGLEEGTEYFYRIGSGGRWGSTSNFTTLSQPGGNLKLQFAIVTDPHVDVDGTNTRNGNMNEDSRRLLGSVLQEINENPELDFLVVPGDLTNGAEADFEALGEEMDALTIPWYPIPGNTDKAEEGWQQWYTNATGMTQMYHSFDAGGYHFVMLDSSARGRINGTLPPDQLDWLERDLEKNDERPTLIFMHHMADRTDEIFGIDAPSQQDLSSIVSANPQVLSITSGHIHQNIRSSFGNRVNIAVAATVQYPIGYSIVTLYEEGYCQSFHKIAAELQTSEESRLRVNTAGGNPNTDGEYLGDLDERSFVLHVSDNSPPSISSVEVSPDTVGPGETTMIIVEAADQDGDLLTYEYEPSGGVVDGTAASVSWTVPTEPGEYTVRVTVFDGEYRAGPVTAGVTVEEEPSEPPEPNRAPGIETVKIGENRIYPGEKTSITVEASDPEGDPLTYHYEAENGNITGDGDEVEWEAPGATGVFEVDVWVSDGELDSEKTTVKITVSARPAEKPEESEESPGFGTGMFLAALLAVMWHFGRKRALP